MNPIVTGNQEKDGYIIMVETTRILTICEALEKRLMPSENVRLVRQMELALFDIRDLAKSIYDQSGEHS